MKCQVCRASFREGDEVIPVLRYVENEKRGDFVATNPHRYVHAYHVRRLTL